MSISDCTAQADQAVSTKSPLGRFLALVGHFLFRPSILVHRQKPIRDLSEAALFRKGPLVGAYSDVLSGTCRLTTVVETGPGPIGPRGG